MIELIGDLGAGKTTFTQGVAQGLECADKVTSPTFTLSQVYPARRGLSLHHFDFYRLEGRDIVTDELEEVLGEERVVAVVEWGEHGKIRLPRDRITVYLQADLSETDREISFRPHGDAMRKLLQDTLQ